MPDTWGFDTRTTRGIIHTVQRVRGMPGPSGRRRKDRGGGGGGAEIVRPTAEAFGGSGEGATVFCGSGPGDASTLYYPAEVLDWDVCDGQWVARPGTVWLMDINGGALVVSRRYVAKFLTTLDIGGAGVPGLSGSGPDGSGASEPLYGTDGGAAGAGCTEVVTAVRCAEDPVTGEMGIEYDSVFLRGTNASQTPCDGGS